MRQRLADENIEQKIAFIRTSLIFDSELNRSRHVSKQELVDLLFCFITS